MIPSCQHKEPLQTDLTEKDKVKSWRLYYTLPGLRVNNGDDKSTGISSFWEVLAIVEEVMVALVDDRVCFPLTGWVWDCSRWVWDCSHWARECLGWDWEHWVWVWEYFFRPSLWASGGISTTSSSSLSNIVTDSFFAGGRGFTGLSL